MVIFPRSLRLAVLFVAASVSSDGQATLTFEDTRRPPLDVKETGRREQGSAVLRDISYAMLEPGVRNNATLVEPKPAGHTRRPAVLFVHWYGPPRPTSNRTQFIPDAVDLAGSDVVSLLIDTPWSDPEYFKKRKREEDYARSVQQVKDLCRALDVLLAQPNIDPARVAYVGHDFGAMYGVLEAANDKRVRAFVFMAGAPSFSDWFLYGPAMPPDARQKFIDELAPLDPVRYLAKLQVPVLLQFATKDEHVAKARADLLVAAAREPKGVGWYTSGHELDADATRDRLQWLRKVFKM
ncbi:MAG TPA: dienelactone hydrolase family protein [Vicinamibacterales bacterium]|nr:dienelactone hydrolase family protein [Vicinamibacterales bacterium]